MLGSSSASLIPAATFLTCHLCDHFGYHLITSVAHPPGQQGPPCEEPDFGLTGPWNLYYPLVALGPVPSALLRLLKSDSPLPCPHAATNILINLGRRGAHTWHRLKPQTNPVSPHGGSQAGAFLLIVQVALLRSQGGEPESAGLADCSFTASACSSVAS